MAEHPPGETGGPSSQSNSTSITAEVDAVGADAPGIDVSVTQRMPSPLEPRLDNEEEDEHVKVSEEQPQFHKDSSKSPPSSPHSNFQESPKKKEKDESGAMDVEPPVEYELSEESKKAHKRHEEKVQELLMRRRANALAVPTNDGAVRARLRGLQQPITLFGEREMERRDRLRSVMARLDADGELEKVLEILESVGDGSTVAGSEDADGVDELQDLEPTQLFYTEGSNDLMQSRMAILRYSLPRSAMRIAAAKRKRQDPDEDEDAELDEVLHSMSQTSMECSEIGDERPLSDCAFSPDGQFLATSSWSGNTKVWEVPAVRRAVILRGHVERVTGVAFHPESGMGMTESTVNLATGSADRNAIVWNLEGVRLRTFEGHLDRLARVRFHPTGAYLGTASFDKTWRLWDVNTGIELLLQEGHSRAVYGIAFQQDGALASSCGLDGLTRVWDLRTGRSILALEGHVKPVFSVDFSPNGYHLATGSEDHTCRIWDLRKRKSLYIIPAHGSIVSQVKFEPTEGYFLVTASYDNTVRVWSGRDFKQVKTLAGHEGKVMGVDVMADGQYIASVAYDRTIKLWSHSGS